jgi:hypothetical protein
VSSILVALSPINCRTRVKGQSHPRSFISGVSWISNVSRNNGDKLAGVVGSI